MKNERYIELKLVSKAKELGGRAFKWVAPGCTGVPDRIMILPGSKIVFVELKRPGRTDGRSPRQEKIMNWLLKMGCEVYLISEVEDIQRMVAQIYGL